MRGLWKTVVAASAMACVFSLVTGCGGGGGGAAPAAKTISGVAAAGAPIIGTVYIKDSAGTEKSVPIGANGSYSIDLSSFSPALTPPYKLKAVGTVGTTTVTYCSVATAADEGGTINITPFTDLIVANIAGQVASNFYSSNSGSDASKITTAAINAQAQDLATKLTPVLTAMGVSSSVDLLRQSFTPGTSALDKVLDIVKVDVDPQTAAVQITNIIDNSQITGTAGGTMTGTLTAPTATNLTDLDQIRQGCSDFVARFATSLPSPTDAALMTLLDPSFMDNGRNRTQFLDNLTSDGTIIGMKLGGVSFIEGAGTNLTAGKALVTFTVTLPNNGNQQQVITWNFQKTGTAWKAMGNQRRVEIEIVASANHMQITSAQNPSRYLTGIALDIKDRYGTSGVHHAVVTGPALPAPAGVTLYNQTANVSSISSGQFTLDSTGQDINNVYWLNQDWYTPTQQAANDAAIDAAFPTGSDTNVPYTIKLYDSTNTLLAQYTEYLGKRPYKLSELSSAPFAVFTKPASMTDLTALQLNTATTIQWTLATGTASDWLDVQVFGTSGTLSVERSLTRSQTSASVTVTAQSGFSATGVAIWLSVVDSFNRRLETGVQTL